MQAITELHEDESVVKKWETDRTEKKFMTWCSGSGLPHRGDYICNLEAKKLH